MLTESQITSLYRNVCEQTGGDGFHVEHMPEFFDTDTMDNSMPHVHTFYEIIWFQEDGGVHSVDFKDYEVKANSIFFLSPGQVHHFDGMTRHKGVLIKFCTDFMREEHGDEDVFLKYNVFNAFDTAPYCIIHNAKVVEELNRLIWRMEQEENHQFPEAEDASAEARDYGGVDDFAHLDMLRALVRILLIYIHRYGRRQGMEPLNAVKPSHRLFVQFRRQLEMHYQQLHAVKDYADLLHVSTKTLTNSVIECSGKTPLSFINDRIILEAKRLLRFSGLMIKEIAGRLGYDDPSYFVKFFKRQMGVLPTEFKEMNITKEQITVKQIAVPTRDGMVDSHFGHCDHYTIFHINAQNEIIRTQMLASPQGCGCKSNIAATLQQMGVSLMLASNMGMGAFNVLSGVGIEVIRGCSGRIEDVVNAYLHGSLHDSAESCSHHNCGGEQ